MTFGVHKMVTPTVSDLITWKQQHHGRIILRSTEEKDRIYERLKKLKGNSVYFQYVPGELIPWLDQMLMDLTENPGLSEKITSPVTGEWGIRVAVSKTPEWYQKLCLLYPRRGGKPRKKPRTNIKRRNILSTLNCMINYGFHYSRYGTYLIEIARGYRTGGTEPWNNQF